MLITIGIIIILWSLVSLIRVSKAEDILGHSRVEMVDNHQDRYRRALTRVFIFGGLLLFGIFLYLTADLYKTVTVHTWLFGDYEREKWTGAHYFAFLFTFIGGIWFLFAGINAIRHYSKMKKFEKMSEYEFGQYLETVRVKKDTINQNLSDFEQGAKSAKRGWAIGQFLGPLLFG